MRHITSPFPLSRTSHVTQSRFKENGKYILAKYPGDKCKQFDEYTELSQTSCLTRLKVYSDIVLISHKSEKKL